MFLFVSKVFGNNLSGKGYYVSPAEYRRTSISRLQLSSDVKTLSCSSFEGTDDRKEMASQRLSESIHLGPIDLVLNHANGF